MVPYMTPLMAEHWLIEVGIDLSDDIDIEDNVQIDKLIKAALLWKEMVKNIENLEMIPGYIIYDIAEENVEDQKQDLLNENKTNIVQTETDNSNESKPKDEQQADLQ